MGVATSAIESTFIKEKKNLRVDGYVTAYQ